MEHHIRCDLGLHHWGPVQGDDRGAHWLCTVCGKARRVGLERAEEVHEDFHLYR